MIQAHAIRQSSITPLPAEKEALQQALESGDGYIWINLTGPSSEQRRLILEEIFHFHPLAIEDCISPTQYPKVDDYGSYLFLVMHGVEELSHGKCRTTELHAFLGKNFLVTYQDHPIHAVEIIENRISRNASLRLRTPDWLLHALLDELVEQCYPAMEHLAHQIEELEALVFAPKRMRGVSQRFRAIKGALVALRQSVRLQREVVTRFARDEFNLVHSEVVPYFRDVADALVHVDETTARYSEELFLSLDVYLNKVANETNEVIKLLTVITAIAMPATVIGTWYGMNFPNIPELQSPWGYKFAAGLTIASTLGLVFWLKSKKWL